MFCPLVAYICTWKPIDLLVSTRPSASHVAGTAVVTVKEALWDVAVEQYGYVTIRDAKQLGIDENAVWMLAARGGLERAAHGVYRFPQLPVTERDPYMLAVLWTATDRTCLSPATSTRTGSI